MQGFSWVEKTLLFAELSLIAADSCLPRVLYCA